ncbi:ABC transporter ATP-binding protein [Psychrobacter sp. HD31]|uniref:ABC transporter ATP-binding protein n=1 Tax=Psychrobacter sp. HD31 TaxID=3112003 RepID=UPI003DA56C1E
MIEFFQRQFALSQQGAKDLKAAIISHSLLNISLLLPPMVAFIFLDDAVRLLTEGTPLKYDVVFYTLLGILCFVFMYAISYIDYQRCYTKMYRESADRRIKLAETLRQLPLDFFAQKDVADLSATIMDDATQLEQTFSHAVPQVFAALVSLSLITLMLFVYQWQMALAVFWVVPLGFLVFFLSKKIMTRDHVKIYHIKRQISDSIQDGLDHVQDIKSYHQEPHYLSHLGEQLDNYESSLIKGELIGGALLNLSHFILKLGLPSVVLVGAYLLLNDSISLFTYLVFLILVGRVYDPFIDTMNNFAVLLYLNVRIKRMREMDNMPRQTGRNQFDPQGYDIVFDEVAFSYQAGQEILKNISFCAKQGEVTALIGASGSGKSTIAKLVARFWDINQGRITIGGENIADIDPETLLKSISIVFQEVVLFDASILDNIRLGNKDATDDEVKAAAKLAQCDDFIKQLPQGYDTLIGENGERLSGGERQRISIARALLKDAPIILLDEATASLDANNESKIQQAISELIKNKTVIIIAHRMRTVMGADNIIAIGDGNIAEQGKPEMLQQQGGIFARMLARQGGHLV